jgi:hypothetical protein
MQVGPETTDSRPLEAEVVAPVLAEPLQGDRIEQRPEDLPDLLGGEVGVIDQDDLAADPRRRLRSGHEEQIGGAALGRPDKKALEDRTVPLGPGLAPGIGTGRAWSWRTRSEISGSGT